MGKTLFAAVIFIFCAVQNTWSSDCNDSKLQLLCKNQPERIEKLFSSLNLDYAGLEKVKAAVERNDNAEACGELLKYYETSNSGKWLREKTTTTILATDPNEILKDTFTFQEVKGTVPRDVNGKPNWNYSPNNDFQWALFLNRHFYFENLMAAYFKTGKTKYVDRINDDLKDWIISSPYEGKGITQHDYKKSKGKWQWTLLEAGSRSVIWAKVFYALYDLLDPDVKILMLSSIPDHFHCIRNFHAKGGNHLAIEMRGLSKIAAVFPEFKDSGMMLDYAAKHMVDAFMDQVYPDGVQTELTEHYHAVAFRAFQDFADTFKNVNRPLLSEFTERLNLMADYLAYVQSPSGYGPLNNDSDLDFLRSQVAGLNKKYHRQDWAYIVSKGREGKKPEKLSVFYPWAGQVIMRSGWDANAQWAFFDIGPWGRGHRHADKLHLSVTAFGRDLLVDSGRYTYVGYEGGKRYPWRDFFIGSMAHNVILIDGKDQKPKVLVVDKPLTNSFITTPEYDFARGEYTEGYKDVNDNISHTRAVLYLRDKFWVVVDRVSSDKPHQIQTLWHWHPDCTVSLDGQSAISTDTGKANLRILPVSPFDWDVKLIKGQEKPFIQGWYSVEYNKKTPNSVAVYTADIKKPQTFVWLLLVDPNGTPSSMDAEIISESELGIRIKVNTPDYKKIILAIPMSGSIEKFSIKEGLR